MKLKESQKLMGPVEFQGPKIDSFRTAGNEQSCILAAANVGH